MSQGYLILEDGQVFTGTRCGAAGEVIGELVFTTGMTGYLETLTDPSYYGQIIMQTFPLIGNYGVIPEDFESDHIHAKAYIIHELCAEPSNFRSQGPLDDFLKQQGIPGLRNVDTRRLTRIVREHGVMNAMLSDKPQLNADQKAALQNYRVKDAVSAVSCQQASSAGEGRPVVLWDFGAKGHIQLELLQRGCRVITMPASATASEILALKPQGIVLSNGPGDPAENTKIIHELHLLTQSGIPLFGICLGHQLLALACGGKTEKMKYGHRGANQPVKDMDTGRIHITSQNHGYCVVAESLGADAQISHCNVNDGSCEGVRYNSFPAISVQFHPEACAGPLDERSMFDDFITMIKEVGANAAQ